MQTTKIAQAVKDYLVTLTINNELSMDMTQLSIEGLEKAIQTALPTEREIMLERANLYLSEGDISIEEMCDAIANHTDGNDMIDNVEGVVVWEKVENEFTCDYFLQEIGYVSK